MKTDVEDSHTMRDRWRRRKQALTRRRRREVAKRPLLFESLEQRVVLSADFYPGLATAVGGLMEEFGNRFGFDKNEEREGLLDGAPFDTRVPGVLQPVVTQEHPDGTIDQVQLIVPTVAELLRAEVARGTY